MTIDRLPAARFTWERALRGKGLSVRNLATALMLSTWANADGSRIRPGTSALAEALGVSVATVKRALQELQEAGVIEQVSRGRAYGRSGGGFASEYRLTLPTSDLLPMNNGSPVSHSSSESYPQEAANDGQNNSSNGKNYGSSQKNYGSDETELWLTREPLPDQLTPDHLTPRHSHQSAEGHQGWAALAEAVDNRNSKPAEEMYAEANRKLSTRPDLGRALMDAAREALGPDASERALVVHAAQQTGWTWTREEVAV